MNRRTWRVLLFVGAVALAGLLASVLTLVALIRPAGAVPSFASVQSRWQPSHAELLDREGRLLHLARRDFAARRAHWVPLEAVSPALIAAVLDGEDRRFWRHRGVDWRAVGAALRERWRGRRRGASTITMQLAALLEPGARAGRAPGALARKLAQVRLARGIEQRWNKREILEAYLNLLGFRGELEGIGATTQVLAGKAPSGLSLAESLVLAALLPAPSAAPEQVVTRACARAQARTLPVDCATLKVTAQRLLDRTHPARSPWREPQLAPHVARLLLEHPGERLVTTLDASLQARAQAILERHLTDLAGRNVRDGAALVVANGTGEVLAYVGSAGPASRAREVDGVQALRQAGSTLKPFLYGLALERELLTAASLLDDSPIALDTASGAYLPQNYDREFKGPVSVRTALAGSLNVPAVRTLVLVGVESFRDRLHALGYTGLTEDGEFYGYSLALGSAEVSLWQQVRAYRALARGGRWSELRLLPAAAGTTSALIATAAGASGLGVAQPPGSAPASRSTAERAALPAAVSFIIADILADRAARAVTFGLHSHLNTPFWSAVKTGTSKDMRDNWCVGFSSRYTVGVWVGNFEGDAMHDVSGVSGAAPAWNELMAVLHAEAPPPPDRPPELVRAAVRFSPGLEAPRPEWFARGTQVDHIVALAPGARTARIVSPANGLIIALDPDIPPARQRVPFTAEGAGSGLRWRLNGRLLEAPAHFLWPPQPGAHRLERVDAGGWVEDAVSFIVR